MKKFFSILVTGSAGFIGFHVARKLLHEGHVVVGVDNLNDYYSRKLKNDRNKLLLENDNYHFYEVDISDAGKVEDIFKSHKVDIVCNLAAQAGVRYSLQNPLVYEASNVKGFLVILEAARKYAVRQVVYASSSSVYGNNKMSAGGFSEEDRVDSPISVYGATKKADEMLAFTYSHLYGMQMTGLRFFTVYGPWGRPDMAYFKFAEAIVRGETIDVYNHGEMRRDFTYIDDIVDGVVAALGKPFSYEIFNLGNSKTVELMDFIHILENNIGKRAKINYMSMQPGDLKETFANIEKASKMLEFYPKTNIEAGLSKFINWYMSYFNRK